MIRNRHALMVILLTGIIALPGAYALLLNGTSYTSLNEVADSLGMKTRWLEKDRRVELYSQWTRLAFEKDKREIELNGNRLFLGFPVAANRGKLYLAEGDYQSLIQPILTPQVFSGNLPALRHVIIDAGHGGNDPGAQNTAIGLVEKSLTLDLARKLQAKLIQSGFRVSLTRNRDHFIPLEERGKIANRAKADFFISLHFNASVKTTVSGVETYALTPLDQPSTARSKLADSDRRTSAGQRMNPWSTLAGYYVQRSLSSTLGSPDRGLKRARFSVLLDLEMPGILVESGFLTHETEGRNIGSSAYREKIASAIAEGLLTYQRSLQRLASAEN